MFKSLWLDK